MADSPKAAEAEEVVVVVVVRGTVLAESTLHHKKVETVTAGCGNSILRVLLHQ